MPNAIRPLAAVPVRVAAPARAAAAPDAPVAPPKPTPLSGPVGSGESGVFGKIQHVIRWAINGPTSDQFKTLEALRQPSVRYAEPKELRAALDHLSTSKPLETAALEKLGARADGYRQIAALLDKQPVAHDVLVKALLDGRLTGWKDLAGRGDALTYLAKMATQPLPPTMDRAELIGCILQEMDDPVKIAQQDKGTCAVTTSTVVLVRKSPAEYARLVQELASPAGQTKTADGHTLKRDADWANDNDGHRTPSMRMLEPPLMQLGGLIPGMKYSNDQDAFTLEKKSGITAAWEGVKGFFAKLKGLIKRPGGLETLGTNRVLEAITGDDYKLIYSVTRVNRPFAWHRVEAALAAGKAVPCGMSWEGGGHEILLDKIENGYAYFNNPWGESDRMAVDEFKANLNGVNLPK